MKTTGGFLIACLVSWVTSASGSKLPYSRVPRTILHPNKLSVGHKKQTRTNYLDHKEVGGAAMLFGVPRGGASVEREVSSGLLNLIADGVKELSAFMSKGLRLDSLLLLAASALTAPVCNSVSISPILGYLLTGMLTGPNGWNLVKDLHFTEILAELGVVFFLFEMGIELSVGRLISMKKDVFGLGGSQVVVTALVLGLLGKVLTPLSTPALVVVSWGLALSSSAFVLQLLRDKDALDTRFGQASFAVLLLQDLAVVPLLVLTPILAGSGGSLGSALSSAGIKALMALGIIGLVGKFGLVQLFDFVAAANNQQAFLALILLTVVSMSFLTEGLGLSNTLGAFLAGVLLSETKHKHKIETEVAPVRALLVGIFFLTVGFEIDPAFIKENFGLVFQIVVGILAVKAAVMTGLSRVFGLSLPLAQNCGAILSQGGEFAFVAFGVAKSLGLLDEFTTKTLMIAIALTMAATPSLLDLSEKFEKKK